VTRSLDFIEFTPKSTECPKWHWKKDTSIRTALASSSRANPGPFIQKPLPLTPNNLKRNLPFLRKFPQRLRYKRLERILKKLLRDLSMQRMHELPGRQATLSITIRASNLRQGMVYLTLALLLMPNIKLDSARKIENLDAMPRVSELAVLSTHDI
jgi:hypothetical protein